MKKNPNPNLLPWDKKKHNQRPWLSWSTCLGWGMRMVKTLECVLREVEGSLFLLSVRLNLALCWARAVTRGLEFQHELFCSKFALLLCSFLTCSCPCKALQVSFVAFAILVSSSGKTLSAFLSTGQDLSRATDWFQAAELVVCGSLCPQ